MDNNEKLYLIDGIGPFFRHCQHRRINWSKIPFESIENGNAIDMNLFAQICNDFRTVVQKSHAMGFNAITLDDVAHLAMHHEYPDDLNNLIASYREAYKQLFKIAEEYNMGVYITTDVMFFPTNTKAKRKPNTKKSINLLRNLVADVPDSFPQVYGIIFRIGECDGQDVKGRFRSNLVIRTPQQANNLIQKLLPVFEQRNRLLIFRTWTVGAFRVGDLIWNRYTFDKVFQNINSNHLVISMKYGESDFFRYLKLNKIFFRSKHKKIIELQAKREYEGSGQYPSFIGWDYEQYIRQLSDNESLIGACIWVQSGGWSVFKRLTFLDNEAIWNEINAFVTMQQLTAGLSTEQAIHKFCAEHSAGLEPDKLILFLRLSSEVVKELLYLEQFAIKKMFFRRVRIPPLLSVFWDQIIINHPMRVVMRCFTEDYEESIVQGYTALKKIKVMQKLIEKSQLPQKDIEFMYDTFEILALSREYYFGKFNEQITNKLHTIRSAYATKHHPHYSIQIEFSPFPISRRNIKRIMPLWIRSKRGYRLVDRFMMIRIISWLSPIFLLAKHKSNSSFTNNRAMGIGTVLK